MTPGSQFPSLTALCNQLPATITRPKRWHWHTVGEVLFVVGFFAFVILFGGGE